MLKRFLLWLWDDGKGSPSPRTERRSKWRVDRDDLLEEIANLHGKRANLYKALAIETGALKEAGHLGGPIVAKDVDFADMIISALPELGIKGRMANVAAGIIRKKASVINSMAERKINEAIEQMQDQEKEKLR